MFASIFSRTCQLAFLTMLLVGCGRYDTRAELADDPSPRFWAVELPTDSGLNRNHPLMPYMRAAVLRELPLNFFRELIAHLDEVIVLEGDAPAYFPNIDAAPGGTIYFPASTAQYAWSRGEWASFYNVLFRAWFNLVFIKQVKYERDLSRIWSTERLRHYQKAAPNSPKQAQEDAWAETVSMVVLELMPKISGDYKRYPELDLFKYYPGRTVSPVSHSDRPGYTPAAETTYPAHWEYSILFHSITQVDAPG